MCSTVPAFQPAQAHRGFLVVVSAHPPKGASGLGATTCIQGRASRRAYPTDLADRPRACSDGTTSPGSSVADGELGLRHPAACRPSSPADLTDRSLALAARLCPKMLPLTHASTSGL